MELLRIMIRFDCYRCFDFACKAGTLKFYFSKNEEIFVVEMAKENMKKMIY